MANSLRILVVDDDRVSLVIIQKYLLCEGYEVICAANGREALALLAQQQVDLVVSDLVMPEMDGIELMQRAKAHDPALHFVFHTAEGSIEKAVDAMRHGAFDYLVKPFDKHAFDLVLQRTLNYIRISSEHLQLREHFRERFSFHNIVTQSPVMRQALQLAAQVSASPRTTISLTGESGVGKEVLARAIHFESGCMPASFVAVNCASIPESLLESELFGHVRGAFTGAEREREGKFSLARGGTILLDEIGDMPLPLQAKLLRVLEERSFEKVGSNTSITLDCRIIVATHRNLLEMVQQGLFRQDLFHRINVVPIAIPPLRERKEDIPLLVNFFLDIFRKHQAKSLPGVSKNALDKMLSYGWPGNVRELRNVLEYATIINADELIRPEHLRFADSQPLAAPAALAAPGTVEFHIQVPAEEISLHCITEKILELALERCGGNKSRAAALLKVNRKMFYR